MDTWFPYPALQLMIDTDLKLIDHYDPIIKDLDRRILALAKGHDPTSLALLRSIHGVSQVLALTILAKRLGIAVYYMLKRKKPFNTEQFLSHMMNKATI